MTLIVRLRRAIVSLGCAAILLCVGCHSTPPAAVPDVETVLGAKAAIAGHQTEATRHLRQALKADPGSAEKRYQLAVSLKNEGKYAEALPLFRSVAASGDKDFVHPARTWSEFIDKRLRH